MQLHSFSRALTRDGRGAVAFVPRLKLFRCLEKIRNTRNSISSFLHARVYAVVDYVLQLTFVADLILIDDKTCVQVVDT